MLRDELGPYFGEYGGRFVPESLIAALDELAANGAPEDPELHEHVTALVEHLEAHAAMEERGWFRLFGELPEAERRAVRLEMAARRAR